MSTAGPQNRATPSVPKGGTGVTATPANSTRTESRRNQEFGLRGRPDVVSEEMDKESFTDKLRRTSDSRIGKNSASSLGERFGFTKGLGTDNDGGRPASSGSSIAGKAFDKAGNAITSANTPLSGTGAGISDVHPSSSSGRRGLAGDTSSSVGDARGGTIRNIDDDSRATGMVVRNIARGEREVLGMPSARAGAPRRGVDGPLRSAAGQSGPMTGRQLSKDFLGNYDQELKDEVGA